MPDGKQHTPGSRFATDICHCQISTEPDDSSGIRRGYRPVSAVSPTEGGGTTTLLISEEKISKIALRGIIHTKELAYSVREVLSDPYAVFQGVRDEGEKDWLCYVGRPKHAYTRTGHTLPPYEGEVFLVFVTDERVVYNWRWEKADGGDERLPQGHEKRFTTRLR